MGRVRPPHPSSPQIAGLGFAAALGGTGVATAAVRLLRAFCCDLLSSEAPAAAAANARLLLPVRLPPEPSLTACAH
jgi:hypothetical protein